MSRRGRSSRSFIVVCNDMRGVKCLASAEETFYLCLTKVCIEQVGNVKCMCRCFSIPCFSIPCITWRKPSETFWRQKLPSEAKSCQNPWYIHKFAKKVSRIDDTFKKNRFGSKQVSPRVNTFEKMISKVKKTDEFLKVACQTCETFVTNFRELKDALRKTMTFSWDL